MSGRSDVNLGRPAIHRIAVPNPFFEGRNGVYVIETDPLTLIDTGVATDKAYTHLVQGLKELGHTVGDVRRVILTHKHIDHIGNAWRIQRESGAEVLIHEEELASVTDVDPGGERFSRLVEQKLREWRVPDELTAEDSDRKMPAWNLEGCEGTPISDGDLIETDSSAIEVLHTPGHTRGCICLKLGDALFTGDHVLQVTSPNIGGGDMRSRGLLGRFLQSLERVRLLGDVDAFPGHGEPFQNLPRRCEQLRQHHDRRVEATMAAVSAGAATVYEVSQALFRKLRGFHLVLGCAEAHAHLEYLVEQGALVEEECRFRQA